MRVPIRLLGVLVAVIALLGGVQSANADSGRVTLTVYKAGWFIGGSGGSGTLTFHGRRYRLGVGGIDVGLVFGGSKTVLYGRVTRIRRLRCLWRGRRRAGGCARCARDRAHQPERRRSGALGPAGRADG